MMELPTADSMYKFIALSGVAIMIAGGHEFTKTYKEQISSSYDYFHKLQDNFIKQTTIDGKLNYYLGIYTNCVAITDGNYAIALDGKTVSFTPNELKEMHEEIEILAYQSSKIKDQLTVFDQDYDRTSDAIFKAVGKLTGYTFLGVIMALVGFISWYIKIQRHQDKIIAKASKNL